MPPKKATSKASKHPGKNSDSASEDAFESPVPKIPGKNQRSFFIIASHPGDSVIYLLGGWAYVQLRYRIISSDCRVFQMLKTLITHVCRI